jgi:hypothetical protein
MSQFTAPIANSPAPNADLVATLKDQDTRLQRLERPGAAHTLTGLTLSGSTLTANYGDGQDSSITLPGVTGFSISGTTITLKTTAGTYTVNLPVIPVSVTGITATGSGTTAQLTVSYSNGQQSVLSVG